MTGARPSTPDPVPWMQAQGFTEAELEDGQRRLDDANAWIQRVARASLLERRAALHGQWGAVAHYGHHVDEYIAELGDVGDRVHMIIELLLAMLADSTIMNHEILAVTDDTTDSAGPDTPTGPADTTEERG